MDGGDKYNLLGRFTNKIVPTYIPDSIFEAVHDGMQGVVDRGTGGGAKVKDIVICGKTGTVENYFRGVKQQNHSFFCGFAPRDNPKIAIMCVVENSGRFGGTYAAPIVGLMIEKYLKDSITEKPRLDRIEQLSKLNLMPPRIAIELRKQDSMRHSRDSAYLLAKRFLKSIRDTTGIDEDQIDKDELEKVKKDRPVKKEPLTDSASSKPAAILPKDKSKPDTKKNKDKSKPDTKKNKKKSKPDTKKNKHN
jgi:penicillin-binding protein 2